jgi:hypothetical protein
MRGFTTENNAGEKPTPVKEVVAAPSEKKEAKEQSVSILCALMVLAR